MCKFYCIDWLSVNHVSENVIVVEDNTICLVQVQNDLVEQRSVV